MPKFLSEDKQYFGKREKFSERYSDMKLWFVADNWPLFSGIVNIARFLSIYDLVKRVIHLPGHFCELGCWNGTNLVYMAKILEILTPRSLTEVFGFDSFQGLQTFNAGKDAPFDGRSGEYHGDVKMLEEILDLYHLQDTVQLIKGNIEDTLPVFLKKKNDIRFSFVYLDADLYSPTKIGIELLYPRMLKGGIMVFDEYNTADWPGETSAVHEVLGQKVKIHRIPYTRQPTGYIVK